MTQPTVQQLLDAGVHFGHLKRKWNPAMAPYIFMKKNGTHIIDLNKTAAKLEDACNAALVVWLKLAKKFFLLRLKASSSHCS
jgi:small subunit ribosomal protein S2